MFRQEAPREEGGGNAMDSLTPRSARARGSEGRERGWESADAMYTDQDFKMGCLAFTSFYKGAAAPHVPPLTAGPERTKEIRLAFVCGYRDAVLDILTWARGSHAAPDLRAVQGMPSLLRSRITHRSVRACHDHRVLRAPGQAACARRGGPVRVPVRSHV